MQRSKKVLVVLCAVLLIGSLAAGPAVGGTWYSARVGQLHYMTVDSLSNGGPSDMLGGMDLELKNNGFVKVLYSIPGSTYDWPVFFQHKVRWVRVNAYLWSADVRVVGVYVYDGETQLGGLYWGWAGGWKNGYHDIYVDLGADHDIKKGLGLAVWLQSGGESAPHWATIQAVSARVD